MSIRNLKNVIFVGYTNYHPIFACVICISTLNYHAFLGIIINFISSSFSTLYLVSLEVGLILDNFNKLHSVEEKPMSMASHKPTGPA